MDKKERIALVGLACLAALVWIGRKAFVHHKTWLVGPAPNYMTEALQTDPLVFLFESKGQPTREVRSQAFIEGPEHSKAHPAKTLSPIDFDGDGHTDKVGIVQRHDSTWELDELNSYARVLVRSGRTGDLLLDVPIRMPVPQTRVHLVSDVSGDGVDDLALSYGRTVEVWFGGP